MSDRTTATTRPPVITCADHSDAAVFDCDACKAALHSLRRRARRARLSVSEQAVAEGARLLRLGDRATAVHRLRLAWRAEVERQAASDLALALTAERAS